MADYIFDNFDISYEQWKNIVESLNTTTKLIYVEPNSTRWLSLEDLPNEIWKDIKDFEGLYQISNYGRVKSLERTIHGSNRDMHYKDMIVKISKNNRGYYLITLYNTNVFKRYLVHRIVAETFIPTNNNKLEVNHIKPVTKDMCDNRVCNLEWVTSKENSQWSIELGRASKPPTYFGKKHPNHKSIYQINKNGIIENYWDCIADACRTGKYERHSITASCKDIDRFYKGFKWFYEEDYERICYENNIK